MSNEKVIMCDGQTLKLLKSGLVFSCLILLMSIGYSPDANASCGFFGTCGTHLSSVDREEGFEPNAYADDRRNPSDAERAIDRAFNGTRNGHVQTADFRGALSFNGSFVMPLCECASCRTGRGVSVRKVHPVHGGRNHLHTGQDYPAACGTKVRAAADGIVAEGRDCTYYVDGKPRGYGNLVVIHHVTSRRPGIILASAGATRAPASYSRCSRAAKETRGTTSMYAHLSKIYVSPGQRVRAGQVIGEVGTTGGSTGCHLHLEVRENGRHTHPTHHSGIHTNVRARCEVPAETPRNRDRTRTIEV